LFQEGELENARVAYTRANTLSPGSPIPLLHMAITYMAQGRPNLAEAFLMEAEECAPKDPFVLSEFGTYQLREATKRQNTDKRGSIRYAADAVKSYLKANAQLHTLVSYHQSNHKKSVLQNLAHAYILCSYLSQCPPHSV
jgi:tetratricopeptide (TPR) repeat protein